MFVNNQLDAQFFFYVCLFLLSTCFEQPCAHHQENQLYQYDIWYMSLCIDERLVCRFGWVSPKPAHQTVIYTGWHIPDVVFIQLIIPMYIRGKMDAQDMILDDITRKQLIWYGHVERMNPTWLPKTMIHWKPEGRKQWGRPWRTWKDGIYTTMNGRDLRVGEWNNRRQWNVKVGRRRQTF